MKEITDSRREGLKALMAELDLTYILVLCPGMGEHGPLAPGGGRPAHPGAL